MIELESGVKGEIATVLRQEEKAVSRFATSSQHCNSAGAEVSWS